MPTHTQKEHPIGSVFSSRLSAHFPDLYAPYLLQGWTQGRRQALRKTSALPRPSWCHALTRPKRAPTRQIYQALKCLGPESTVADSSNNMWISCKGKDLKHS